MKVIDVRFRDPVQVGGITASARVSWRREDGPCSVSDGYVTCGDTLVPLTNVAWLRLEPIAVTEQTTPSPWPGTDQTHTAPVPAEFLNRTAVSPAPGKGKKR